MRFRFGIMEHFSKANTAYLDFDSKRAHDRRRHKYYRPSPNLRPMFTVLRLIGLQPQGDCICYEATRRGWHVLIPFDVKLKPAEQVALQFALGSDDRRECLNLMRALSMRLHGCDPFWRRRWNILFGGKL